MNSLKNLKSVVVVSLSKALLASHPSISVLKLTQFCIPRGVLMRAFEDACGAGDLEAVKRLALGASKRLRWRKGQGLVVAAVNGHLGIVEFLVHEAGAMRKNSALRWAAAKGHLGIVEFLVAQGADVTAGNNEALWWAAKQGQLKVVEFLVAHGADVTACHSEALRFAAYCGHLEVVTFLVDPLGGSDVTARNSEALRWATSKKHLGIVEFLVAHGANNAVANDTFQEHSVIVELLA